MELNIHNFPERLAGTEPDWLEITKKVVEAVDLAPKSLQIIFTDDATLKQMHLQYLNDPSETDVITFDLGEGGAVEGEIYISIDRAVAQAAEFAVSPEEEVLRLIVHGVLHLKGYDDVQEDDRRAMKTQENRLVDRFRTELP